MISNKALQKRITKKILSKGQPRGANSRYYIFVTHLPMVTSNGKKGVVKSGEGKGLEKRQPCCCKEGASGNSNSLIAPLIIKDLFPNSTMK